MLRTKEKIVRVFVEVTNEDVFYFKHEDNGRLATDCILINRKGVYWLWSCKSHRYIKFKLLSEALKHIDKEVNGEIH